MAINQTKIFDDLEKLTKKESTSDFILDFLKIFDFPKATITRLKKGGGNPLNVALQPDAGEVGIKQILYFKKVPEGEDVYEALSELRASQPVKTHKIRFCLVTDFKDFAAYDARYDDVLECSFSDLFKNYPFFFPLLKIERSREFLENPADVKASEKMGRLFDVIKQTNNIETPEAIHALNVFMTRLLFCFFAEDTDIIEKNLFTSTLESNTDKNGYNFAQELKQIFAMMNAAPDSAYRKKAPQHISKFPYVNGGLFEKDLPLPEFTGRTRRILLECGKLDWSEINPDIFGSMFQAVIDPDQRRNHGQHYTSVPNIMKAIQPLFVEELEAELAKILSKKDAAKKKKALHEFSMRLGQIKIFDPACGSGNFLIISYKELRRIEMEVFKALKVLDSNSMFYSAIHLKQFYGIELDDFAYEIAILSLWLAEHQMNVQFKLLFGDCSPTLPLKQSGNVIHGNSLLLDWDEVVPRKTKDDEVYIVGNPPFGGSGKRTASQTEDMAIVLKGFKIYKFLDYVSCWFWKGTQYIKNSKAKLALVSTNSISQGDQVAMLWPHIFECGVEINFAYQSFPWKNNAKQNAGVHVVIIGLTSQPAQTKILYKFVNDVVHHQNVSNISPYLIEGSHLVVSSRSNPICDVLHMVNGNKPTDGGHLLLTPAEKDELIALYPEAKHLFKKLIGAEEYLKAKERWCLWLNNYDISELNKFPKILERVNLVKKFREKSVKKATQSAATIPHLFEQIRQNTLCDFILIPRVSSERREYVPIGFMDKDCITNDSSFIIPQGGLYELGILMSAMHNDWMRIVCGRLESRYRYSASVVYNCFPWPQVSDKKKQKIIELAEEILLIREDYPAKTLAELYDPDHMPEPLRAAHKALDAAVDKLYRSKPFIDASERISHLFELYSILRDLKPEDAVDSDELEELEVGA